MSIAEHVGSIASQLPAAGSDRPPRRAEDQLGRAVAGREADAVARLLLPRLRAGERRAHDEDVLSGAPSAPPAAARVDGHAGARHRVLVEVAGAEPLARRARARRAPAGRAPSRAPASASRARCRRTRSRPWPARPSRRRGDLAQPDAARARAVTRAPARSAPTTTALRITRPPARRSRVAQRCANTRMPGTDGGSVGISNTRPPEALLQLAPDAVRVRRCRAPPGTRRARRRRARPTSWAATSAAEGGIVERAGEAERVDVGAAARARGRARPRAPRCPRGARLSASSGAWKSLSARNPTTQTGAAAAQVAGRHRLRHDAPTA